MPSDTVVIRPAKLTDLDALTDVLASSFHRRDGLSGLFYPVSRALLREDVRSRLRARSPHTCCLVAVAATASASAPVTILGTVEVALRTQCFLPVYPWFQRVPYISNLAVLATHRRQGIASQLLAACEPIARSWQGVSLYLHVLESNQAARSLYQRMGYGVVGNAATGLLGLHLSDSRQLLLRKSLTQPSNTPSSRRLGLGD